MNNVPVYTQYNDETKIALLIWEMYEGFFERIRCEITS